MKYFTKYLQVPGEITPLDVYLIGDKANKPSKVDFNKKPNHLMTRKYPEVKTYGEWLNKVAKKSKLFLCSRDIQVGDTIKAIHNNTSGIVTEIKDGKVEPIIHYGAGLFSVQSLLFKVIGEISPDAKWVKEGMEFTEEQVELWHKTPKDYGFVIDRYIKQYTSNWIKWVTSVKVKCPNCEYFH